MCIRCDATKLNDEVNNALIGMSEALIDAMILFQRIFKQVPVESVLDPAERKVYDRLLTFAKGSSEGEGEFAKPTDEQDKGALIEALKKAFPGAQIVVGSPDEIDAMIQKTVAEANGKKSN